MDRTDHRLVRQPVLYVEDHPINALLMEAFFEHRPELELVVASTGQQALDIATRLRPVLLLLDLNLPDCHGSDLLQWLRRLPGCSAPPAVAVTSDKDFDITGTGFVELWAKPLRLDRVLERLDDLTAQTDHGMRPEIRSRPQDMAQPSPWR